MSETPRSKNPFNILEEVVNWKKSYQDPAYSSQYTGRILCMIEAFEEFCKQYIKQLNADPLLPEEWFNNRLNYALLEYWEPILKAAEHHQVAPYRALLDEGYGKLAEFTDSIKNLLKKDVEIALYFDKVGKYKRYPFGDIFLIGIPLLDAYHHDWMAMPHELGHHVFWNSKVSRLLPTPSTSQSDPSAALFEWSSLFDQEIDKNLPAISEENNRERRTLRATLEAWSEEIFADILGVRIAGEEFADSGREKLKRNIEKADQLFVGDRDHPIPYLLPYIRDTALDRENDYASLWKERFGDFVPPKIEPLQECLGKVVKGINSKMKDLRVIQLTEDETMLGHVTGRVESNHPRITSAGKNKLTELFLNLYLLEEGEGWRCQTCDTINSWWDPFCDGCSKLVPG
jgi:hypothetical protein